MFVVAWLCVAAVVTPLLAGTVVCTADGGHRAVEMPHDATGCAAVAGSDDTGADHSPAPCDDRPVADIEAAPPAGKATDHATNFAIAFAWSLCPYVATADPALRRAPCGHPSDYLPSALSQRGLRAIILLI
jgi:hypothetical protein